MRRPLILALIVTLALALFGAATTAEAATVQPIPGHYRGEDADFRTVDFDLNHHGFITDFRIGGLPFPDAHLQGSEWGHQCLGLWCARGRWLTGFAVLGVWTLHPPEGPATAFEANLVSFNFEHPLY